MVPHRVKKIATKKLESLSNHHLYTNGLLNFTEFYRNAVMDFDVCKLHDNTILYNYDFELLHQQKEMSTSLMAYITFQFPENVQVIILDPNETFVHKLLQNTIFILSFDELLLIDRTTKVYYVINPKERGTDDFSKLFVGRIHSSPKKFLKKKS